MKRLVHFKAEEDISATLVGGILLFIRDKFRASSYSPPSPPPSPAPVVMQHDGLMANVLPTITRSPPGISSIQQQEGSERGKEGEQQDSDERRRERGCACEREMFSLSPLLSFDQAVGRLKLFQHTAQVRR